MSTTSPLALAAWNAHRAGLISAGEAGKIHTNKLAGDSDIEALRTARKDVQAAVKSSEQLAAMTAPGVPPSNATLQSGAIWRADMPRTEIPRVVREELGMPEVRMNVSVSETQVRAEAAPRPGVTWTGHGPRLDTPRSVHAAALAAIDAGRALLGELDATIRAGAAAAAVV